MGREADCRMRRGRSTSQVRALLESGEILVRGAERMKIPFTAIRSLSATRGWLRVGLDDGEVAFELGDQAAKWLDTIRNPKSRLDKLGVKPGLRIAAIAVDDETFAGELKERGVKSARVRAGAALDIVFLGAAKTADLAPLETLTMAIAPAGAVWVVWPKGRPELREDDVRAAAKRCGLVDVKVVAFSASLSALKLVIPLSRRAKD